MQGKSSSLNRIRIAQVATGMSPADHPLGSLESRSIARVLLDHVARTKPQLSEYDEDACTIYRFARHFLRGSDLDQSFRNVQGSLPYQRGCELNERESVHESHRTPVSFFEELFERSGIEPPPRDAKWREPFLWCFVLASLLQYFQAAWERQLVNLPFPIRTEIEGWEDARLYLRQSSGEWTEEINELICRRILGPVKELQGALR
jgi:hypothetical protein